MKIIAVVNQKGGASKTTNSTNLAVTLVNRGFRVVLIDIDGQESSGDWYRNRLDFYGDDNGFLVVKYPDQKDLQRELNNIHEDVDFIIIDGKPGTQEISQFAALNADLVLVPMKPSASEMASTMRFLQKLPSATPVHIILSRCPTRKILHCSEVIEALEQTSVNVMSSRIFERAVYLDCFNTGRGVIELHDKKAISEINLFCDEVLDKLSIEVMA